MKKLSVNSGFTLIESIVAIFAFSIIVLVIGAAMSNAIVSQRQVLNLQQAEENANLVLESMIKEIRVSQICPSLNPTGCDSTCPASPAATLSINHPVNGNIIYSLAGGAIHRNVNGTDTVISSNTVQFTSLKFCIQGTVFGDKRQPEVTIITSIKSVKAVQQATIDIQAGVSQRFLND